jgi:hypothetical protein
MSLTPQPHIANLMAHLKTLLDSEFRAYRNHRASAVPSPHQIDELGRQQPSGSPDVLVSYPSPHVMPPGASGRISVCHLALLLSLLAVLTAFLVQSGEISSSDSQHRLQAAHSFWTSDPPVFPEEYPEFGIHGRGGKLYGWYGIGQSLLLLPFDVIGTHVQDLPIFKNYREDQADPTIRNIVVTYGTNSLVCVLSTLVCFRFLLWLRFTVNQSVAGALALLFGTTFLHYTQNMMENNLILLLTLTGFCFQYEWLRTARWTPLLIGSLALGANLTIRLTTSLDAMTVTLFIGLVLWTEGARGSTLGHKLWMYTRGAAPCYAAGLLIDRVYQYERFGSFWNTYISVFASEQHKIDPTLPAHFPWTTPLRVGILGPLISPEKSIFLFDPLLILTLLLAAFLWRRLAREIKVYVSTGIILVALYILFYARFFDWSGDFAWGDRYVSTAVELVALISVPLFLRHRAEMNRFLWTTGLALWSASILIQLSSIAFWCPLEIYQMETLGHPTFVIALRFKNIAAFLLGKMDAWGLNNQAMTEDPWDYLHITTFNFLPFVLRRIGQVPQWLISAAITIWTALIASILSLLAYLGNQARQGKLPEIAERVRVDRGNQGLD